MFKVRFFRVSLAGLLLFGLAGVPFVCSGDIPKSPDRWVTDRAGFLSSETLTDLDAALGTFEQKTGHQVIVYIDKTSGGVPIEDWAAKVFADWRVGRKGLDDGLVLFIMTEDRKIRIEVGYGLEDRIPDITAGRIINDTMIPAIRNGENDKAVKEAVSLLLGEISGESVAGAASGGEQARVAKRFSTGEIVLAAIAVIFFLILFITNPSLAVWLLFSLLSGGRGGGGGGGGGFRGGGGRSGGGGASGSW